MLHYQTLAFTTLGEILKAHIKTMSLKYQLQHGMIIVNY